MFQSFYLLFICIQILFTIIFSSVFGDTFEPRNWFTSYPKGGSSIGPFFAISWPIQLTDEQEMLFSFYYEANFALPSNITQYYDNYTGDSRDTLYSENANVENTLYKFENIFNLSRLGVYEIIENRLTRQGYNGPVCLLKFICEVSFIPIHTTSLLSDIVHLILTPSSSASETGLDNYVEAETLGAQSNTIECDRKYSACETSVADLLPLD